MLHGGKYTCGDHPFTHKTHLTKMWLEPQISSLDSSDQRTHFHQSNVHCSCFLAQASLFFLLVSFSSGLSAASQPWTDSLSLLSAVDVDLSCLNSVKHLFGLQFLRLITLTNVFSAAEVTLGLPFLWQSSWEPVSS